MRNTRWIDPLGRLARPLALAGALAVCGSGCHRHYYYYGNPPDCPPGTMVSPSGVAAGPVCDVSGDIDSKVGSNSSRSVVVNDGRRSRVVVSEPSSSRSRFSNWRISDPEGPPAVTQVEGAIEDSTVKE